MTSKKVIDRRSARRKYLTNCRSKDNHRRRTNCQPRDKAKFYLVTTLRQYLIISIRYPLPSCRKMRQFYGRQKFGVYCWIRKSEGIKLHGNDEIRQVRPNEHVVEAKIESSDNGLVPMKSCYTEISFGAMGLVLTTEVPGGSFKFESSTPVCLAKRNEATKAYTADIEVWMNAKWRFYWNLDLLKVYILNWIHF